MFFGLDIMRQGLLAEGYADVQVDYRMRDDSLASSKKDMVRSQWNVYRNVLGMGVVESAFYLCSWALNGILKYRRI